MLLYKRLQLSASIHISRPGLLQRHCRSDVYAAADASIPVHINNICERNYVSIQGGRRVVPTELGITLVRGYQLIDPELCQPQVGWRHQPCKGLCTPLM